MINCPEEHDILVVRVSQAGADVLRALERIDVELSQCAALIPEQAVGIMRGALGQAVHAVCAIQYDSARLKAVCQEPAED